ncbi:MULTISPECIES: IclR family transcriptional regulator [Geobacillus]|uniref:IclR family transcriptional regulator n=1 Tax=Geobacillus genomosp. 3 TaxID=1921421 RepID=S6A1H1_GEOG3|nr:IclR family transcriptional regulator [Geobacillus genomosp. 3]AGT31776.1 IclR family transcriptional regulator [Geobacillus genomosp. 3]
MIKNEKSTNVIQSLQVGLNIIDIVATKNRPLKFTEIQELTGITKSNLYKYLNTLTMLDVLYRDKKDGTYSLGGKFIEYCAAALGDRNVIGKITPYLREISASTSQTALLAVWTHGGPVIVDIYSANYGLNIGAQVGTRLPLLSATGKVFAAFKDERDPQVKEWKQSELRKLTDERRKQLEEEIEGIRQRFFSYALEPLVKHVSSFSVPVLDFQRDLVAAVTVVGFTERIPKTADEQAGKYIMDCVAEISKSFGFLAD